MRRVGTTHHSSPSPNAVESMFSARIVSVDYSQAFPSRGFDVCFSEFRGCEVYQVPVLRIFGTTPAGQKACLHVHDVFPYLSIPFTDDVPANEADPRFRKYTQDLALNIDRAINANVSNNQTRNQHVYKIIVISGISFYGFHEKQDFLRIYFYSPDVVKHAAQLFANGEITNSFVQPYEAHIPYTLQFFIDYNLFGMNFVKVKNFKFREPSKTFVSYYSPLNSRTSRLSKSTAAKNIWRIENIDGSLSSSLERETYSELELDCSSSDILNVHEEQGSLGGNPGLKSLWDDERLRRRLNNEISQITPESSQERYVVVESSTETLYRKRIHITIEQHSKLITAVSGATSSLPVFTARSQNSQKSTADSSLSCSQDREVLSLILNMVDEHYIEPDSMLSFHTKGNAEMDAEDAAITLEMSAYLSDGDEGSNPKASFAEEADRSPASYRRCEMKLKKEQRFAYCIPQVDGAGDEEISPPRKKRAKVSRTLSHVVPAVKLSDHAVPHPTVANGIHTPYSFPWEQNKPLPSPVLPIEEGSPNPGVCSMTVNVDKCAQNGKQESRNENIDNEEKLNQENHDSSSSTWDCHVIPPFKFPVSLSHTQRSSVSPCLLMNPNSELQSLTRKVSTETSSEQSHVDNLSTGEMEVDNVINAEHAAMVIEKPNMKVMGKEVVMLEKMSENEISKVLCGPKASSFCCSSSDQEGVKKPKTSGSPSLKMKLKLRQIITRSKKTHIIVIDKEFSLPPKEIMAYKAITRKTKCEGSSKRKSKKRHRSHKEKIVESISSKDMQQVSVGENKQSDLGSVFSGDINDISSCSRSQPVDNISDPCVTMCLRSRRKENLTQILVPVPSPSHEEENSKDEFVDERKKIRKFYLRLDSRNRWRKHKHSLKSSSRGIARKKHKSHFSNKDSNEVTGVDLPRRSSKRCKKIEANTSDPSYSKEISEENIKDLSKSYKSCSVLIKKLDFVALSRRKIGGNHVDPNVESLANNVADDAHPSTSMLAACTQESFHEANCIGKVPQTGASDPSSSNLTSNSEKDNFDKYLHQSLSRSCALSNETFTSATNVRVTDLPCHLSCQFPEEQAISAYISETVSGGSQHLDPEVEKAESELVNYDNLYLSDGNHEPEQGLMTKTNHVLQSNTRFDSEIPPHDEITTELRKGISGISAFVKHPESVDSDIQEQNKIYFNLLKQPAAHNSITSLYRNINTPLQSSYVEEAENQATNKGFHSGINLVHHGVLQEQSGKPIAPPQCQSLKSSESPSLPDSALVLTEMTYSSLDEEANAVECGPVPPYLNGNKMPCSKESNIVCCSPEISNMAICSSKNYETPSCSSGRNELLPCSSKNEEMIPCASGNSKTLALTLKQKEEASPLYFVDEMEMPHLNSVEMPQLQDMEMPQLNGMEMPQLNVAEMPQPNVIEMPQLNMVEMQQSGAGEMQQSDAGEMPLQDSEQQMLQLDAGEMPQLSVLEMPQSNDVEMPQSNNVEMRQLNVFENFSADYSADGHIENGFPQPSTVFDNERTLSLQSLTPTSNTNENAYFFGDDFESKSANSDSVSNVPCLNENSCTMSSTESSFNSDLSPDTICCPTKSNFSMPCNTVHANYVASQNEYCSPVTQSTPYSIYENRARLQKFSQIPSSVFSNCTISSAPVENSRACDEHELKPLQPRRKRDTKYYGRRNNNHLASNRNARLINTSPQIKQECSTKYSSCSRNNYCISNYNVGFHNQAVMASVTNVNSNMAAISTLQSSQVQNFNHSNNGDILSQIVRSFDIDTEFSNVVQQSSEEYQKYPGTPSLGMEQQARPLIVSGVSGVHNVNYNTQGNLYSTDRNAQPPIKIKKEPYDPEPSSTFSQSCSRTNQNQNSMNSSALSDGLGIYSVYGNDTTYNNHPSFKNSPTDNSHNPTSRGNNSNLSRTNIQPKVKSEKNGTTPPHAEDVLVALWNNKFSFKPKIATPTRDAVAEYFLLQDAHIRIYQCPFFSDRRDIIGEVSKLPELMHPVKISDLAEFENTLKTDRDSEDRLSLQESSFNLMDVLCRNDELRVLLSTDDKKIGAFVPAIPAPSFQDVWKAFKGSNDQCLVKIKSDVTAVDEELPCSQTNCSPREGFSSFSTFPKLCDSPTLGSCSYDTKVAGISRIAASTPEVQKQTKQAQVPHPSISHKVDSKEALVKQNHQISPLASFEMISPLRKRKLNFGESKAGPHYGSKKANPAFSPLNKTFNSSSSQIEGPTTDNTGDYKLNFGSQEAIMNHDQQHLTLMSLEVHVNTRNDLNPDPEFDAVSAVFFCVSEDSSESPKNIGVIGVENSFVSSNIDLQKSAKHVMLQELQPVPCVSPDLIFCVSDEPELFLQLVAVVRKFDPDILLGYEIEMLSIGYLLQRASYLNMNLSTKLSRHIEDPIHGNDAKDNFVKDLSSSLKIPGRIVLNVWRLMRKEASLNDYTFENVFYHVMHNRTPRYSFETLSHWYHNQHQSVKWRVLKYYLIRVSGNIELLEKLNFIQRTSELARIFGIQFYEVLSRGSQFRVESMMLRAAKPRKFIPVSPTIQQRSGSRAPECIPLIFEPESRFYTEPVIVLDFQSLYPSMIIAYNYCFSTCLGRVDEFGKDAPFNFGCTSMSVSIDMLQKLENDIHISPAGVAFVKSNVRRGVLPEMLEEILKTRIMVKCSLKQSKSNRALCRILEARQLGLKLIANVTYGYTSANYSGRMPCVEVADSIVSKGRETLENAIRFVESSPKWGAKVVYGDTDSLFILLSGRTKEEAFRIGQEIADFVTSKNPSPVKLKFEKVYLPCVLQTKKRYFGYMYETVDQEKPIFDAKGIETVRRDSCDAVRKILEKSAKILFDTKDLSLVKKYIQKQFTKVASGRVNIVDYIFAKEYRGQSGYRPGACVPALEIARKRLLKDPRSEPRVGERVPYVVVYGFPGLPIIQLVKEPHQLLGDPSLRINAKYYITRVISPPLDRVLSLIGIDVKKWYSSISQSCVPSLPMVPSASKPWGTLSQYFTALVCPACENPTTSGLCSSCQSDPQSTAVLLNDKIRSWERTNHQLSKICHSCMKNSPLGSCISIDCPVLFRLNQAQKDFSQAPYVRNILNELLKW